MMSILWMTFLPVTGSLPPSFCISSFLMVYFPSSGYSTLYL